VLQKNATESRITVTWLRPHAVQRPTRQVRLRQIRRSRRTTSFCWSDNAFQRTQLA